MIKSFLTQTKYLFCSIYAILFTLFSLFIQRQVTMDFFQYLQINKLIRRYALFISGDKQ